MSTKSARELRKSGRYMGNEKRKSLKYTVLDVFTETRYNGNQLAVVRVEKDLEKEQYEKISRE